MLNLLFYITLFTLSLGQFSAISKSGETNLYLFDVTAFIFFALGTIILLFKRNLVIHRYFIFYIIFGIWAAFTILANLFWLDDLESLSSISYLLRYFSYVGIGIIVFNCIDQNIINIQKVFTAIVLSGVFIALAGFIQLALLPDFEILDASLGWDPHKNRLASTFFDPNFTGGFLNLSILFAIFGLLSKKLSSTFAVVSILIMSVAVIMTFSRSSWGMMALIILIFGIFRSRKLLISALIIAFLAYFAIPRVQTRLSGITDPSDSAQYRLISWQNAIEISKDNFIYGVGFNTFRYAQRQYRVFNPGEVGGNSGAGTDSSFLLVLATTGIIGMFVFTIAYIYPIINSLKSLNEGGLMIICALGGLFLQSQFINAFFYPQMLFLMMIILGSSQYLQKND